MFELYSELNAYDSHELKKSSGHSIYFEEAGNQNGIPVIFLHGGPGSGSNENHRRYFNPDRYRIILFDQRGCNRSRPNGFVEENTTQDLLSDIESIRKQLNIDQWMLFGGSWGATLALLYAEQFPQYVSGIILRGTFLARQCDFDWFAKGGVSNIFPDYWQAFLANFDDTEKCDLLAALHQRVFSNDKTTQLKAAKAWALWAGRVVTHSLGIHYVLEEGCEEKLVNEVKIEMHYAINKYFIKENQILDNISKVPDVPVMIVHGRKDLTCLAESSWSVHQQLHGSEFVIVPDAGHLASEPAMIDALVTATDKMAKLLS